MKLLFVFGRNKLLSLLELLSHFKANSIERKVLAFNEKAAVVEFPKAFDAEKALQEFAGIIKISSVEVEASTSKGKELEGVREEVLKSGILESLGKKFFYSLNDYSSSAAWELFEFFKEFLKQEFKERKLKGVLKWPRKGSSVAGTKPSEILKRKKTIEYSDFNFLAGSEKVFFGKTIAVSNPLEWMERDNARPEKDEKISTSIRLARILVNLSLSKKGQTVLDSFCGIGTVMQEALLLGRNAVGVDKNSENARKARKNLEWLQENFKAKGFWKVYCNDSAMLSGFLKEKIQAVVTEPFLGPLIREKPSREKAVQTMRKLEELYFEVFKELGKVLEKESIVVFITPQISFGQESIGVSEQFFLKNGFKVFDACLQELGEKALPFLYKDSESRIERLIWVLKKT